MKATNNPCLLLCFGLIYESGTSTFADASVEHRAKFEIFRIIWAKLGPCNV